MELFDGWWGAEVAAAPAMNDWRRRQEDIPNSSLGVIVNLARSILSVLLLACALSACSPDVAVGEADYAAKIVGGWQGTVGDDAEMITFGADGKFVSEVRPRGFISNTLGQGVTGTIRGTWAIRGKMVTLNVSSAQDERLLNRETTGTIESFKANEIVVKSSVGETSTFRRLL